MCRGMNDKSQWQAHVSATNGQMELHTSGPHGWGSHHGHLSMPLLSSQGGSFDVADRMFHSVKGAWESASRENMSDVRELTPEFFFLPEFLTNCNAVEFGEQRSGRWWALPHSSGLCHHLC